MQEITRFKIKWSIIIIAGFIAYVTLLSHMAHAMDWYVWSSTDPAHGESTKVVSTSTNVVVIPIENVTYECGVTAVQHIDLDHIVQFDYRELMCRFADGTIVSTNVQCLTDGSDSSDMKHLSLKQVDKLADLSVQCMQSVKHDEQK